MKVTLPYLIGIVILMTNCVQKSDSGYIPVVIEVGGNDSNVDAFLSSNYYFIAKYIDPTYEPYGQDHWDSVDSTRTGGFLKIRRVSSCRNDTIENEHFNFYGKCILRQSSTIDTVINKTSELVIETQSETNNVSFTYDNQKRIEEIVDSLSNLKFQFIYSDNDLLEIKEFQSKDKINKLESVIKFKRI